MQYNLREFIDLEDLRQKLPVTELTLRILLPDETRLTLSGSGNRLEEYIANAPNGPTLVQVCESALWGQAALEKTIFSFSFHNVLTKIAGPLMMNGRLVGILISGWYRRADFQSNLKHLSEQLGVGEIELQAVVQSAPEATGSQVPFQLIYEYLSSIIELRDRDNENRFLSQAFAQRDLDELLKFIVTEAPNLIWNNLCSVFLWDPRTNKFILRETSSERLTPFKGQRGYSPGVGLTGWVGQHGLSLLIKDVSDAEELSQYARPDLGIPAPVWSGHQTGHGTMMEGEPGPCMIVPINAGFDTLVDNTTHPAGDNPEIDNMTIGIIRLSPQKEHMAAPSERQYQLFKNIARLIYGALRNAQRMRSMISLAEAVGVYKVDVRFATILNHISDLFRSFSSHIRIKDKSRDLWYILSTNDSDYSGSIKNQKPINSSYFGEILSGELPYRIMTDMQNASGLKHDLEEAQSTNECYATYLQEIGSTLTYPLTTSRGEIIGMLHLHRRVGEKSFLPYHADMIQPLATLLGRMLSNLVLSDRKEGHDELFKTDILHNAPFEEHVLFEKILNAARTLVSADLALIRVWDENKQMLKLLAVQPERNVTDLDIPRFIELGKGSSGRAYNQNKAFLFPDTESDEYYQTERALAEHDGDQARVSFLTWVKSTIAVPLNVMGADLGVLIVVSHTRYKFTRRDVDIMEGFADEASLILLCARLAERESTARINAEREVAKRASHRVGDRIFAVSELLKLLQRRIERGRDANDTLELISSVRASVEDAHTFLRDFRSLNTAKPLRLIETDLNNLIVNAIKQSKPFEDGVNFSLDENIPHILCDKTDLKHCFEELAHNALKAGATRLNITTTFASQENQFEIRICNNGVQIPAHIMNNMFEPLVSGNDDSGFGLAIVKDTIGRHGGSIGAETSPELTCFIIHLPKVSEETL